MKGQNRSELIVVYKKPEEIIFDSFIEDIYREANDDGYAEIKLRLILFGVTSPVIISPASSSVSDPRIVLAAIECGIQEIPCIISEDSDELKRFQLAMDHKDELMAQYKILMHDIPKKRSVYSTIIRKEILEEVYNIKQGDRSDLNPETAAAIKERNSIASKSSRTQINRILEELAKVFGDDRDKRNKWLKSHPASIGLKNLHRAARILVAKTNDATRKNTPPSIITKLMPFNPNMVTNTDKLHETALDENDTITNPETRDKNSRIIPLPPDSSSSGGKQNGQPIKSYIRELINIFNTSCRNIALLPNEINLIVTSPPYHLFRAPQEGVDNSEEFGLEVDPLSYAENLASYFFSLMPNLAKNATIYVNLADKMIKGCFQHGPELFTIKMVEKGFDCIDKIWWVKKNVQFGEGENTSQNVEYILKFCVAGDKPYSTYDWILDDAKFQDSKFGTDPLTVKMSSFINLKEGHISTSTANTARLRKLCIAQGFYLKHTSTYMPEVPYAFIKTSGVKNGILFDPFNGCANTAIANLWASELNMTYYGTELNEESVKASWINIHEVYGYSPMDENQIAA